ncbi:MAG TPA: HAD family hydrolase [Pseudonocardiaceae bacterium]|jgi:phosphoglycolate phosphatase-like HAD superfamily hydrolase|nr:HAD family hydrolase [Pseudonocardiaceae bacterium]
MAGDTVIFDVDGTLMDTNYHHAIAWYRALRSRDVTVPVWRIHRAIGMGGDKLVADVAGDAVEAEHGDALRARWKDEYDRLIDEVVPFAGAHDLLRAAHEQGRRVALASSGDSAHVERYLDLLDARTLADEWTTAQDAEDSKPAPDLIGVALRRVGGGAAVVVGDSTWDCLAAGRAGLPSVAVRTGGFSEEELRESGAVRVFESLPELRDALADLPVRAPRSTG